MQVTCMMSMKWLRMCIVIFLLFLICWISWHCRSLCDTKAAGKLNSDQFALAMHLVQQKLKGIDPPTVLSPDMIPPSLRTFTFPVCLVSSVQTDVLVWFCLLFDLLMNKLSRVRFWFKCCDNHHWSQGATGWHTFCVENARWFWLKALLHSCLFLIARHYKQGACQCKQGACKSLLFYVVDNIVRTGIGEST